MEFSEDYFGEEDMPLDYHYDGEDVDGFADEDVPMSLTDIYSQCLEPTFTGAFTQVAWALCSCLVLRLFNDHLSVGPMIHHLFSFVLGLVALFSMVEDSAVVTVIFGVLGFLVVNYSAKQTGLLLSRVATVALVGYLVSREYMSDKTSSWEQVRGIHMIMVMKILSICFDVSMGLQATVPSLQEYLGYVFCPANIIFGPWIPFGVYCKLFQIPSQGLRWIVPAFGSALCAFLSLGVSSCMLHWTFLGIHSKWILTFRDAMAVRFSHYFISYLSELSCILCGFVSDSIISVTEPWRIEFPRSLVDVVVCWNKPMHRWLRTYIFRPSLDSGVFKAVLWTFAVSSMLHGLNFALTSVLLSLGFYTYVEHTLREKIAAIFDACVNSRACRSNCRHKFKWDYPIVLLVNFIFGILACCNLAYLGIMLSKSHGEESDAQMSVLETVEADVKKWKDLHFFSHWTMISIFLGSLVIY